MKTPKRAWLVQFNAIIAGLFLISGQDRVQAVAPVWTTDLQQQNYISITFGQSPAVAVDSTIYVGLGASATSPTMVTGLLVALDKAGVIQWQSEAPGAVKSSPVVGPDGSIYFTTDSYLRDNTNLAALIAVAPDSIQKWIFEKPLGLSSPALGADGSIWVASTDQLYRLKPDGTVKQSVSLVASDVHLGGSVTVGADGAVYIGATDGRWIALNEDGSKRWEYQAGTSEWSAAALGPRGTIYVGGTGGTLANPYGGKLFALNPNGSLQWEFIAGGRIIGSPVVGSDTVYVAAEDGILYALQFDGTLKWKFATDGQLLSTPAIDAAGNVYLCSTDKKLCALSPLGEVLWTYNIGLPSGSSPVIGPSGMLCIGGTQNLFAFELGQGPAASSWPMLGQNVQHTARAAASEAGTNEFLKITEQPRSITVANGSDVTFSTAASGPGSLRFQWRFNGKPILGATNSTLNLKNATLANAGRYSAYVQSNDEAVSSISAELNVLPALSKPATPLALTGWNADVIQENGALTPTTAFEALASLKLITTDGSSFFESGYLGHTDGLPSSRQIVSEACTNVIFQLQPYTGSNVVKLVSTVPAADLVLAVPMAFQNLFVLAASAYTIGGDGQLTLNFSDGTSSPPIPFKAPSWYDSGNGRAVGRLSALRRNFGSNEIFSWDNTNGFSLHETDIDLAALNLNVKPIRSITFRKPGFQGRPYISAIFAVSGIPNLSGRPSLGIPKASASGGMEIPIHGASRTAYAVEASIDLVHWTPLITTIFNPPEDSYIDHDNAHMGNRFYRLAGSATSQ